VSTHLRRERSLNREIVESLNRKKNISQEFYVYGE
jgi:hypothetical protein